MVKPGAKVRVRLHLREELGVSDRRVCRVLGLARSTARYQTSRAADPVVEEVLTMAAIWRGCGYRRTHDELRKKGLKVNRKKVERLFRVHKLGAGKRTRRVRMKPRKDERPAILERNQMWAMDFVSDRLDNGSEYRMLTVLDVHTRECLAIDSQRSLTSCQVVAALDRVAAVQGLPDAIRVDNGPEFISHALASWASNNNVHLAFTDPGSPTQNGHIESFNGTLRAECIDLWWMQTMTQVKQTTEQWRRRYNTERTHFVIKTTPAAFVQKTTSRPFRALSSKNVRYRPGRKVENAKAAFSTFLQDPPPLSTTMAANQ